MKPEHFVEPCANPVTLQTFISPTDNPGPGASAAAAASSIASSTSMLFWRRLLLNEACLLVLRALVLTDDLYRD